MIIGVAIAKMRALCTADLFINGTDIKVCGIIRPNDDAVSTSLSSGIGYTAKLTEYIIEQVKNSEIAKAQLADTSVDVFTGVPFDNDRNTEITMDDVNAYMATLSPEESAQMQAMTSGMSDDQILQLFSASLKARTQIPHCNISHNLHALHILRIRLSLPG